MCLSGGNFPGTIKDCLFISDGHSPTEIYEGTTVTSTNSLKWKKLWACWLCDNVWLSPQYKRVNENKV
jgi:6-phosphogluconolactonase/glucosamine-6-phosphate isomerase/deaminase